MRWRALLAALLIAASARTVGAEELLFPPVGGGGIPLSVPFPVSVGGTGNDQTAFTDGGCVQAYLDHGLVKLHTIAASCSTITLPTCTAQQGLTANGAALSCKLDDDVPDPPVTLAYATAGVSGTTLSLSRTDTAWAAGAPSALNSTTTLTRASVALNSSLAVQSFNTSIDWSGVNVGSSGEVRALSNQSTITRAASAATTPAFVGTYYQGTFNHTGVTGVNDQYVLAKFKLIKQGVGTLSLYTGLDFQSPTVSAGAITQYVGVRLHDQSGRGPALLSDGANDPWVTTGKISQGVGSTTLDTSAPGIGAATDGFGSSIAAAGVALPFSNYFTNQTGGTSVAGHVVLIDTSHDYSFVETNSAAVTRALGIVLAACSAGADCPIATSGQAQALCTGTINRADWITTSATTGVCQAVGAAPAAGASFGRALNAGTFGAGTGVILVAVNPN
jgi:hypothetical protein